MNKCILKTLKPAVCANILNGDATVLLSKTNVPVGTKVYIYCTKSNPKIGKVFDKFIFKFFYKEEQIPPFINGKVVASFVVDKVFNIIDNVYQDEEICELETQVLNIYIKDCLSPDQVRNYLKSTKGRGYALHISQLKIFDKPKELEEFQKYGMLAWAFKHCYEQWVDDEWQDLIYVKKAPSDYCYVEEVK